MLNKQLRVVSFLAPAFLLILFAAPSAFSQQYPASKLDPQLRMVKSAAQKHLRVLSRLMSVQGGTNPTVNVFLRVKLGWGKNYLQNTYPQARFHSEVGDIVTAQVPISMLDTLDQDPNVLRAEHSGRSHFVLDVVRSSTTCTGNACGWSASGTINLGVLQNGVSDLTGVDGTGVVVGDVDSGIDWTHADFRNSNGTTRLLSIWDQTIPSNAPFSNGAPTGYTADYNCANPPFVEPFNGLYGTPAYCGTEYTNSEINTLLSGGSSHYPQSGNSPYVSVSSDTDGHGSHVMGIIAGNGLSDSPAVYIGMAPKADLVMVRSSLGNDAVVDGINYIISRAAAKGEQAVINLSIGDQFGPHDGTSLYEQAIGNIAASTPIVVSMGNDNDKAPHAMTNFGGNGTSQTFQVYSPDVAQGINAPPYAEFWFPSRDAYSVTVTLQCSGGPSCSTSAGPIAQGQDTASCFGSGSGIAINASATVFICNNVSATNGGGTANQILVAVNDTARQVSQVNIQLTRTASGGSGHVDGYTDPAVLGTRFLNLVAPNGTVGEPATANNVFAVAAYDTKNSWSRASQYGGGTFGYANFGIVANLGQIATFSAEGPTRDGRQKPEVAAPGFGVASVLSAQSVSSLSSNSLPGTNSVVSDGLHIVDQGTSMSAPVVTGFIAQVLQTNPGTTVSQIHALFGTDGTPGLNVRSDSQVTSAGTVPNNVWGYGKLLDFLNFPPAAPQNIATTMVGVSSITWTWPSVFNATSYHVYTGTTATPVFITTVTLPSFTFTGLAPNSQISVLVDAVGSHGESAKTASPSAVTFAAPVSGTPVENVFASSIAVSYQPCSPVSSCAGYLLNVSTDPTFSVAVVSSSTANSLVGSLAVTGLSSLTQYYLRLASLNSAGAADFIALASTSTLFNPIPPSSTTPLAVNQSTMSLRFLWLQGVNGSSVAFNAQISTDSAFGNIAQSSATSNDYADFGGLSANTKYYLRVQTAFGGQTSAFNVLGEASTLAVAPSASPFSFPLVTFTSMTVAWTPLPSSPSTVSAEGYEADLSTDPAFGALAKTSIVSGASTSQTSFSGLTPFTTYYVRLGSLNWDSVPDDVVLGSTETSQAALVVQAMTTSGANLFLMPGPANPCLESISIAVPPGAFPIGTPITLNGSPGLLPAATQTNEGSLLAFGGGAGFSLTANGFEPNSNSSIIVAYSPPCLPKSGSNGQLQLARFDDTVGTWSLIGGTVDPAQNTISASINHFSTYGLYLAAQSTDVGGVNIFPIPWEIGNSANPQFTATSLTFSNLPASTDIKIYSIKGQLIWEGTASSGGVLNWNGLNKSGGTVATGTYLAVISGNGKKIVRRVVIIR